PREPVVFPVFVPFAVDRVVDFFVVAADPLALPVAFLSSGASADVFEAAAFVLRRRDDCMDAAGSLRASGEVVSFSASPLSSAVFAAAAVGLRRRDDCMDAAGSLRAAREVFSFSASPLPSSALLPEKKTSTGRSVEFASGINAPSPRPRPRFLRSATTYSSIRYFLSGFAVGQRAAGMWVI